jgi:polynucleotide 5'-kinase involved in rRNA processing
MRWRREETKIVLNEKWRNEISNSQLNEFERVAGKLNCSLGYND